MTRAGSFLRAALGPGAGSFLRAARGGRASSTVGRGLFFASLMVAVACGGAGNQGAKNANPAGGDKKDAHDSIAEMAAQQGGLAALGGAGNREESTGIEAAMGTGLQAGDVEKKNPVKLDGLLKEWPARTAAGEAISGSPQRLGLEVAVQYDDARVYVAAEITDAKLTRSNKHADGDDHVTFAIAFPAARGQLKGYEVGLWPGKPGELSGAVKWTAGPSAGEVVAGAKIVEYDGKGGTTFEAAIPWSSFAEARTTRVGLRAALRYHDADGPAVLATSAGGADKPAELAPLPTGPERAVVDGLLTQKNLAAEKPRIDVYADVAGDERKERVSMFGRFFTICGPGYRGGRQFFWREVPADIVAVETRELTGRAKDDLVVRKRVAHGGSLHEMLEVWAVLRGDEPVTVFAHQMGIATTDGKKRVTNSARISTKEIEISVEPAIGWDATTFKEPLASDMEPVLLPWGPVRSKTFRFEQGKFTKASEVAQAAAPAPAPTSPPREAPSEAPTPSAPRDTSKQVLATYMKDAAVPAGTKPRFDLEIHVDGDAKPERVLLVGRDVVVLGPSFKGGSGYARLSLTQFGDEKDVSELTARDLNGDGAAEILVRGARHAASPTGEKVVIEALFVYQVRGGNIARVFAIETGREVAGKRLQGQVQFVPSKNGKGFDIDVRPGFAKGFTDKTYPWPQDKPGAGPVEPLLLPWGNITSLRYAWNGTAFVVAP